jgi:integrase
LVAFQPEECAIFIFPHDRGHDRIAAKQTVLEKHLVPVLGKKRLNEIGDYEVQKVKRHLAAMKPKTVNCVLTVLSKLLKVAVDWEELASMPVSVKMVKAPDPELPFYDFEECEQLVEGAGQAGADVVAFVLLAGEAGLRRGEVIALERSDIDFKRNQITVRQSDWQGQIDTPKSGKTRRVPMTARLAVALQASGTSADRGRSTNATGSSSRPTRCVAGCSERKPALGCR